MINTLNFLFGTTRNAGCSLTHDTPDAVRAKTRAPNIFLRFAGHKVRKSLEVSLLDSERLQILVDILNF